MGARAFFVRSNLRVMPKPALAVYATLAAALTAIWAWQAIDLRASWSEHREEHQRIGVALLGATEGPALRECRGGYYTPASLQAAMEATAADLGTARVEIRVLGGEVLAEVGASVGGSRFFKPFVPPRPRGRGPGGHRRGSMGADTVPLPDGDLEISIELSDAVLEQKLSEDTRRFLVTGTALTLALFALAIVWRSREQSLRLAASLETSRERVRALEFLGRIGAGLAHETRNPLGVVRGHAQRMREKAGSEEETRRAAAAIEEETDRTLARLDEFLMLSRPAPLRSEPLDLRALLSELAELLVPDLESKGAVLEVRGDPVTVEADRDQARRLFLNLLLNSVQAIDQGGRIEAVVKAGCVRIVDDGPGVPEEIRESLFEPYVSARAGGTGLGLALARQVADAHGWSLRHQPGSPDTTMIVELS
jgi:signal transduction histidine kinase